MGLLDGVKVVELGLILPGAALGHLLAEQGADVVKVERPTAGDYVRYFPEQVGDHGGQSFWHLVLNRNKRSIMLDLLRQEGQEVLHDLARDADVFITNLIADQPARLGASYDALRAIKPDLIYCQITGFGATGPYAALPSHGRPNRLTATPATCGPVHDSPGFGVVHGVAIGSAMDRIPSARQRPMIGGADRRPDGNHLSLSSRLGQTS